MNALVLMEDVNTIALIQLVATIAHVMLAILWMTMITAAHVSCDITIIQVIMDKNLFKHTKWFYNKVMHSDPYNIKSGTRIIRVTSHRK